MVEPVVYGVGGGAQQQLQKIYRVDSYLGENYFR